MQTTLIPADPEDLHCDTCTNRFASRGSQDTTDLYARVAGWHIYRGAALPGNALTSILCPSCVGTPRTRIPVPSVPEGQMDILGELEFKVTVTPLVKKKRGKGREMS